MRMYTIFAKIITNLRKKNVEQFILTKSKEKDGCSQKNNWDTRITRRLNKKCVLRSRSFSAPLQPQSYSPF